MDREVNSLSDPSLILKSGEAANLVVRIAFYSA